MKVDSLVPEIDEYFITYFEYDWMPNQSVIYNSVFLASEINLSFWRRNFVPRERSFGLLLSRFYHINKAARLNGQEFLSMKIILRFLEEKLLKIIGTWRKAIINDLNLSLILSNTEFYRDINYQKLKLFYI